MEAREVLEHFRDSGEIVRVCRESLENRWVDGYVVACGTDWFALEVFDNAARLDGFSCMRYADVSECKSAPYASFHEKALAVRKLARQAAFPLDLSSIGSLIRSAGNAFPLVSMSFDDDEPYCFIGKILAVSDENVRYLYISPNAVWDQEPETCALETIVRVDVGGAYEEALFLVGGRS